MLNVIIKDVQSVITNMEFVGLSSEQKDLINSKFNTFIDFQYAKTDDYYAFIIGRIYFGTFEHYLGMEYAKKDIEYYVQSSGYIIVVYGVDCDKANRIIELLDGENDNKED